MKSGLEDRNNSQQHIRALLARGGLNEVRPGRPEQSASVYSASRRGAPVSMKSGLEDRNNLEPYEQLLLGAGLSQ